MQDFVERFLFTRRIRWGVCQQNWLLQSQSWQNNFSSLWDRESETCSETDQKPYFGNVAQLKTYFSIVCLSKRNTRMDCQDISIKMAKTPFNRLIFHVLLFIFLCMYHYVNSYFKLQNEPKVHMPLANS